MGVTRLANVTGLDRIGIPVTMATQPNSRSTAIGLGAGLDLATARVSAAMKAVETFHAERITSPLRLGSAEDLGATLHLADVTRLPRGRASGPLTRLRLLWIEGWDLMRAEPVCVPYELIHTRQTLPAPPGSGAFHASRAGLAAGNHLLEAVIHALGEIVERDARARWVRHDPAARHARRLDLATIDAPDALEALARYAAAGTPVAAWDITSAVGLPTFRVAIGGPDAAAARSDVVVGFGCHPARAVALRQALTEAAAVRLALVTGCRDMPPAGDDAPTGDDSGADPDAMPAGNGSRDFHAVPDVATESLADDLNRILEGLRAAGVERAIAVDLTRPEFRIPVVRVVAPGLEERCP
jgi:ribosomal protein S12 methylthiotransferase accessory factor